MLKSSPAARAAFAVFVAFASSLTARADDTPSRTRVTIRGTGTDVAIDRTSVPRTRSAPTSRASGALDDAVALKAQGADDTVLVAYLSAHLGDLPPVIDAKDVRQLRRAGAGKTVVAYLATVAAVDIGPTGWERSTNVSAAAAPPGLAEAPISDEPLGYFSPGGYGPVPPRLRSHGFLFRRAPFSTNPFVLNRPPSSRRMPSRRRLEP